MATWVIDGSRLGGATPRRWFSDDDKARIVSAAMMLGASVAPQAGEATWPGRGGGGGRPAPALGGRVLRWRS